MRVTRNTKISRILRENIDAIDTIAKINKHFKKLKNPMLRRVLAPRVTVKDAAKIGNITTNEFLKHLEDFGFNVEYDNELTTSENTSTSEVTVDADKITLLDVRPTINAGNDPFGEIMGALKNLKEDEILEIINVFEPTPLIQIMEEKGYESWTKRNSKDEYHTFFRKNTTDSHKDIVADMPITEGSFEEKLLSYGENLKEIDVRHLEMPEPMVTILKELDSLPENYVLLVHHKKTPQFLLPELKSRNFTWMHKDIEPGKTDLLIFKNN
jgi:uncharacterized protein (DUF2249 family)